MNWYHIPNRYKGVTLVKSNGGGAISPDNVAYPIYLQHFCRYNFALPMVKGCNVLEVGCGEGYGTILMASKSCVVTASDVNFKTVKQASLKYKKSNLFFLQNDATTMPFKREIFDTVVAFEVLEHIKDTERFLKEIVRVMKQPCTLILSTPNKVMRLAPGQPPWNPYHIREFSPYEFRKLLQGIFSSIEMYGLFATGDALIFELIRLKIVKWNLKKRIIYKLIPFNLLKNKLVFMKRLINRLNDSNGGTKFIENDGSHSLNVSIENYYIKYIADGEIHALNNALSLMAICKK